MYDLMLSFTTYVIGTSRLRVLYILLYLGYIRYLDSPTQLLLQLAVSMLCDRCCIRTTVISMDIFFSSLYARYVLVPVHRFGILLCTTTVTLL